MDTDQREINALKRKLSDDEETPQEESKKIKIDDGLEINILNLSDCLLMILFSYLDATSLYLLGKTCARFKDLVNDPCLWRYIEARRRPNTVEKVLYCEKHVNDKTTHAFFRSDQRYKEILSNDFFLKSNLTVNLQILALENQRINGQQYPLKLYPYALKELSLKRSFVTGGGNFFRFAKTLENLRVLILDHCQWVETSNLISIANFKSLEILSMYMCKKLSDLNIGYISLAAYGFKNLKILDVRFTGMGNRLLSTLYKSLSLQEMYFQGYCSSYQLDRFKRKLNIIKGAKKQEYSYLSDDDEHLDTNARALQRRFEIKQAVMASCMDMLDDGSVIMFKYVEASQKSTERPKSVLWKDVYDECKCGFSQTFWETVDVNDIGKMSPPPMRQRNVVRGGSIDPGPSTSKARHHRPRIEPEIQSSSDDEENYVKKRVKLKIRKHSRRMKRMLKTCEVPDMFFITHINDASMNVDGEHPDAIYNLGNRELETELELSQIEHTVVTNRIMQTVVIVDVFRHNHEPMTQRQEVVRMPRADGGPHADIIWADSPKEDNDDAEREVDDISSSSYSSPSDEDSPDDFYQVPEHYVLRDNKEKVKSSMKRMSLCGYPKITNRSLMYLGDLNLDILDVRYTNVTEEGVTFYMMHHPNCRVIHESACVCGPRMHF